MKPLPDVSLAIVGVDYPNKRGPTRRFELAICQPGERLELRSEPNNEFDEFAVAVFSLRGIQLGYIASERAVRIAPMLARGVDVVAVFQAHTARGGLMRVAFDGAAPALPPDPGGPDMEPEYYPDDEWSY